MAIIRVKKDKENPYVIVNKQYLEDTNLSFKAKGLMTYLLSKPDDWKVYLEQLKKSSKDGRNSINTAIKQLMDSGYMVRSEKEKKKGQYKGYDYTVYEKPQRKINLGKKGALKPKSIPRSGSSVAEKPYTENQPLLSNDNTNELITNNKEPQAVCDNKHFKGTIKRFCKVMINRYCPDKNNKKCMEWFNEYRKWLDIYLIEKNVIKMSELVKFKKSNKYYPIFENHLKNWLEKDEGMPTRIKQFRNNCTDIEDAIKEKKAFYEANHE